MLRSVANICVTKNSLSCTRERTVQERHRTHVQNVATISVGKGPSSYMRDLMQERNLTSVQIVAKVSVINLSHTGEPTQEKNCMRAPSVGNGLVTHLTLSDTRNYTQEKNNSSARSVVNGSFSPLTSWDMKQSTHGRSHIYSMHKLTKASVRKHPS